MQAMASQCMGNGSKKGGGTFCESQARRSLAKSELGSTVPRKMGLNWFMPALANSRVGSLWGTTLLEGTAVWPLLWKNSMKVDRTLFAAQEAKTFDQ